MRAHRGGHPVAPVELLETSEHQRHPLEREREREHAAAVDRGRDLLPLGVGGGRDLGEARVLDGMGLEPVAAARPAMGTAEREHAGVLARAVVLERRRPRR